MYAWCVYFRVIGLCLLQNEICPLYLNRHVLKYLLGRKIGWHDLAFFDPVMYDGMRQLVHDAETKDFTSMFSALELTFAIDLSQEEVGSFHYKYTNNNNMIIIYSDRHQICKALYTKLQRRWRRSHSGTIKSGC